MKIVFRSVEGYQPEPPDELDTESSPDIVYLRKDIEEVEDTEGTHWKYMEAQLTREEYAEYVSIMESPAQVEVMQTLTAIQLQLDEIGGI